MSVRWLILAGVACGPGDNRASFDTASSESALQRTGGMHDTGSLPLQATTDQCPDDPNKEAPGFCGCSYLDLDLAMPVGAETCVHIDAVVEGIVEPGATVEALAYVGPGAVVGAGASIGAGAHVATRATVGADADIGVGVIIGRRASVGAGAIIGPDSMLSRSSSVGADVDATFGSLTVSYGASLGDRCELTGPRVTLGSLVQIGADCVLGGDTVFGRGTVLGDRAMVDADVVAGPNVTAGTDITIGSGTRVRKDVAFADAVTVGLDARIGRGSTFASGVSIGDGASVRAGVDAGANAIIEEDAYIPRNTVIPERSLDPCEPAPGDVAPPPVVVSSPLTLASDDLSLQCADVVVSSTLTVSGPHRFRSLTVQSGGVVTHPGREVDGVNLVISNALVVEANGRIDVVGKGGLGGTGNSAGNLNAETWVDGQLTRDGGADEQAGGSYGAVARNGTHYTHNAVYGDPRNPVELGSGGGIKNSTSGSGGRGGGRIDISATDAVIDGVLIADGSQCYVSCGSGSGGAIRLRLTGEFAGTGELSSVGLWGTGGGSSKGGDGRIAVTGYTSKSFSGAVAAATVFMSRDDGYGVFRVNGVQAEMSVNSGETIEDLSIQGRGKLTVNVPLVWDSLDIDGAIVMNAPLTLSGGMVLGGVGDSVFADTVTAASWWQDGSSRSDFMGPVTVPDWTVRAAGGLTFNDTLTLSSWTQTSGPVVFGDQVDVAPSAFTMSGGSLTNHGTLQVARFDATTFERTATVTNYGSLLIADDSEVVLGYRVVVNQFGDFRGVSQPTNTVQAMTIASDGSLQQRTQHLNGLHLTVLDTLDVQSGGSIDVTGAGALGGSGTVGQDYRGERYTPTGPTREGGAGREAGGSYGSLGDFTLHGTPNDVYGDPRNPMEYGSGGGVRANTGGARGGAGGGIIDLVVGDLVLDGLIRSDGGDCSGACGTGSGGAVRVQVSGSFSGAGALSAQESMTNGYYRNRGESGGRIAVTGFASTSFTGTSEAGTVFIKGANDAGHFKVDGNGAELEVLSNETITSLSVLNDGALTVNVPITGTDLYIDGSLILNAPLDLSGEMHLDGLKSSVFADAVSAGSWRQSANAGATFQGPVDVPTWVVGGGVNLVFEDTVVMDSWTQTSGTVTFGALADVDLTTLSVGSGTVINEGILRIPRFDATTFGNYSRLTNYGTVRIVDDAVVTLAPYVTVDQLGGFQGDARPPLTVGALTLENNAKLQQRTKYVDGLIVTVLGHLDVQTGARIDVTGAGGEGGTSQNHPSLPNLTGETWSPTGPTRDGGANGEAAGGYGTPGNKRSSSFTNALYGDPLNPVEYGSGGDVKNSSGGGARGGAGGGRIDLIANSAVIDGSLIANGGNCNVSCGAGSGGAIRLQVAGALSGSGAVTADGGTGNGGSYSGGGGRIAVTGGDVSGFTAAMSGGTVALNGVLQ